MKISLWCLPIRFVSVGFALGASKESFIGASITNARGKTTVILDWLKTREKLDPLFRVLESIEWSLRKEKAKTIVCVIHETMINLEGVGAYESEVVFIQKFPL